MNHITSQKRSDALPPPPKSEIANALNIEHVAVEWLAGDGSDRCYYRLTSPELPHSLVLMQLSESDAVKLKDDGYDWLKVARILKRQGLKVPAPIKNMNDHAALIIEDYGDLMLESWVLEQMSHKKHQTIESMYQKCFGIIATMLGIPSSPQEIWCERAFDVDKYSWELRFFRKEYLEQALKLNFTPAQSEQFEEEVENLSVSLSSESKFFVHRDFHSRNLMVTPSGELAIIDFQDARLGSPVYDLVSLIFDNYVPFSPKFRASLLNQGLNSILESLHESTMGHLKKSFKHQLKTVILQRQLKAIGTYGFLTINKKRGDYLRYVQPALESLSSIEIADERWPFLSSTLLDLIKRRLHKK